MADVRDRSDRLAEMGSGAEGLSGLPEQPPSTDLQPAAWDLGRMASLVAHELRSPLQVMMGYATLIERVYGPQLDEPGRDMLGWILKGAARQEALIVDLVAYARVVGESPRAVWVDLEAVMLEVADTLALAVSRSGASVVWDRLPTVWGDRGRLLLVLQHLVGNAIVFVAEGVTPKVHVFVTPIEGGWRVSVEDNGIGIDAADRDKILAMFGRLHPRDRFESTGMGLTICRHIVEAAGGEIWFDAAPDGGTVFHFTLVGALGSAP